MKSLICAALILSASPAIAASVTPAKNAEWAKMVEQQAALALVQKPNEKPVVRFCEASEKSCTRVIVAKRGGKMTMLAEVENFDEQLIARMICKLNDSADIRTCVDFDRGTLTKAVYDSGRWHPVGVK